MICGLFWLPPCPWGVLKTGAFVGGCRLKRLFPLVWSWASLAITFGGGLFPCSSSLLSSVQFYSDSCHFSLFFFSYFLFFLLFFFVFSIFSFSFFDFFFLLLFSSASYSSSSSSSSSSSCYSSSCFCSCWPPHTDPNPRLCVCLL